MCIAGMIKNVKYPIAWRQIGLTPFIDDREISRIAGNQVITAAKPEADKIKIERDIFDAAISVR
jgi:hypothetical protein